MAPEKQPTDNGVRGWRGKLLALIGGITLQLADDRRATDRCPRAKLPSRLAEYCAQCQDQRATNKGSCDDRDPRSDCRVPTAEAISAAQRVSKQFQTVIQTSPSVQNNPRDSSTDTWKLVTMGANQGRILHQAGCVCRGSHERRTNHSNTICTIFGDSSFTQSMPSPGTRRQPIGCRVFWKME